MSQCICGRVALPTVYAGHGTGMSLNVLQGEGHHSRLPYEQAAPSKEQHGGGRTYKANQFVLTVVKSFYK